MGQFSLESTDLCWKMAVIEVSCLLLWSGAAEDVGEHQHEQDRLDRHVGERADAPSWVVNDRAGCSASVMI